MSDNLARLAAAHKLFREAQAYTLPEPYDFLSDIRRITSEVISAEIDHALTPVRNIINDSRNAITTQINTTVGNIQGSFNNVASSISGAIGGGLRSVSDAISDTIGMVVDRANRLIDTLRNTANSIIAGIREALRSVMTYIGTIIGNAMAGVIGAIRDFISEVRRFATSVVAGIQSAIQTAINNGRNFVRDVVEAIKAGLEALRLSIVGVKDKIEKTIEDIINDVLAFIEKTRQDIETFFWEQVNALGKWFAENVMPVWDSLVKGAQDITATLQQLFVLISNGDYQGAFDLLDSLFTRVGLPAPIQGIFAIVSTIAYFWETVRLQFIALEIKASKDAIINLGMEPIGLESAAMALFRGAANEEAYRDNARLSGVSQDRALHALEAIRAKPTPGAIQEGFLRGEIDEATHDTLLGGYGYTPDNIALFKALYHLIPPPTDLIRMAVRETFTPSIAERFGQYEDFPDIFAVWAEKQGIDKEWAERYWAAHWDLPSATMGYEMFQRRIIDRDELVMLLRALDVMPYWREKLIQLSYNPITRVDLRRMYKMKVLSEDDVYNGYLDIGYSPENARRLTEFTKRYDAPEDASELDEFRQLARTTYSQAYKTKVIHQDEYRQFLEALGYHRDDIDLLVQIDDYAIAQKDKLFDTADYRKDLQKMILTALTRGLLDRSIARAMLIDLGYSKGEVELELDLIEYNRMLRIRDLLVDRLHEQYVEFVIDQTQLRETFDMFGFTSDESDLLIEEWNIERAFRSKRPPLTDLRKFLMQGLITLEEFLDELRGLGYHERYITLYRTVYGATKG